MTNTRLLTRVVFLCAVLLGPLLVSSPVEAQRKGVQSLYFQCVPKFGNRNYAKVHVWVHERGDGNPRTYNVANIDVKVDRLPAWNYDLRQDNPRFKFIANDLKLTFYEHNHRKVATQDGRGGLYVNGKWRGFSNSSVKKKSFAAGRLMVLRVDLELFTTARVVYRPRIKCWTNRQRIK